MDRKAINFAHGRSSRQQPKHAWRERERKRERDRQTDGQTDRQTDRQTGRQAGRQADRDRQTDRPTYRQRQRDSDLLLILKGEHLSALLSHLRRGPLFLRPQYPTAGLSTAGIGARVEKHARCQYGVSTVSVRCQYRYLTGKSQRV